MKLTLTTTTIIRDADTGFEMLLGTQVQPLHTLPDYVIREMKAKEDMKMANQRAILKVTAERDGDTEGSEVLTLKEAESRYKMDRRAIIRSIENGLIQGKKIGGKWIVESPRVLLNRNSINN